MTSQFHDTRLPEHIESGSKGGPEFNTTVIEMTSGREQRNKRWALPRASWDITYGIRDQEDYQLILAFFYARRGRAFGFRFKDWSDYACIAQSIATGDSVITAASATLTINTLPLTATTVTIDGQVYNLVTGDADAAYKVKIVTDIATTCTNLINAVNATGTPGIATYGVGTLVHPTVLASAGAAGKLVATARTPGTGGNALTAATTIDGAWDHSPFQGGLVAGKTGSGTATFQLLRTYSDLVLPFVRRITRPVAGTIAIYVAGVLVDPAHYDQDVTTGKITFHDTFVPTAGQLITADFEFDMPVRFDSDKIAVILDWVNAGTIDAITIKELRESDDAP